MGASAASLGEPCCIPAMPVANSVSRCLGCCGASPSDGGDTRQPGAKKADTAMLAAAKPESLSISYPLVSDLQSR